MVLLFMLSVLYVLEKLIVEPLKATLKPQISKLHRGFCERSSSANTGFLLTEAIAEAKDQNIPLYGAFLDASKAFDVVWHAGMLAKLSHLGVSGNQWQVYHSLYQDMTSQVKEEGLLSRSFEEKQGVRQGGIPSTELFKCRGHQVLEDLEQSNQGFSIGEVDVSAPTCADDMTLLSSTSIGLQRLLTIAQTDAALERYQYSKAKSKVMVFGSTASVNIWKEDPPWILRGNTLDVSAEETHLGLIRTPKDTVTKLVQDNIKKARRSAYSLMSAGMYGINGVHPRESIKLWQTFALPVLLYGLEGRRMCHTDIERLEKSQRQVLRCSMNLPTGTANAALHILTGVLPVEALLHKQTLTQFANFIRDEESKEAKIISRQVVMKDNTSCSTVTYVKELLAIYDLPSVYDLLTDKPSKYAWKKLVTAQLRARWTKLIQREAELKPTLKFLNISAFRVGELHPVWKTCSNRKIDIIRSCNKAKLLVGRYYLEEDHAKFRRGGSALCLLCGAARGDLPHFLIHCPKLEKARETHLHNIIAVAAAALMLPEVARVSESLLIQLLVDCTAIPELVGKGDAAIEVEHLSRLLLYKLHQCRAVLLAQTV